MGRYALRRPELFRELEVDLEAIRCDLDELRQLVSRLDMVSLGEALEFMLRVEWGAAERHARFARTSNRKLAEVLHDLYVADTEHFTRIQAFVAKQQRSASS